RDLVIAGEVALAFTLLVGAGLLMRSFLGLCDIDLGIQPDHVLITRLSLPADRYRTAAELTSLYRPLLERVRSLPGVVDVAETTALPPYGGFTSEIEVAGRTHPEEWDSMFQLCSEGYFAVLRFSLLEGRTFHPAEVNDARHVAVVNKSFADRYLATDNPIGRRVRLRDLEEFPDRVQDPWFEIIGVVHDAKNQGLQLPARPEVWLPYTVTGSGQRGLLVHTIGEPTMLMNNVRDAVWATDRSVALTYTGSLENFLNTQSYAGPRFGFVMMGIFAAIGFTLVVIGVYSVV